MTTKKKKVVEENPKVQEKKEIQVKDLNLLTKQLIMKHFYNHCMIVHKVMYQEILM